MDLLGIQGAGVNRRPTAGGCRVALIKTPCGLHIKHGEFVVSRVLVGHSQLSALGQPCLLGLGAPGRLQSQWPWTCSQAGPVGYLWVVSGGSIPPAQAGCLMPGNGHVVLAKTWALTAAAGEGPPVDRSRAEPQRVPLSGPTPVDPHWSPTSALPGPVITVAGHPHLPIQCGHLSRPQGAMPQTPPSRAACPPPALP